MLGFSSEIVFSSLLIMNIKHTFYICYRGPKQNVLNLLEEFPHFGDVFRKQIGRSGGSIHLKTEIAFNSLLIGLDEIGVKVIKLRIPKYVSGFKEPKSVAVSYPYVSV